MGEKRSRISICIPHWQVRDYMTLCLRSIRKHSAKYDLEIIVVDNGSKDDSLDYLRSLEGIRLIERPEEVHTNWPENVFSAWDRGIREATGEFFITMHSDVFVKQDGWLDPLLRAIDNGPRCVASGAWKLELKSSIYLWQKRAVGYINARLKSLIGRKKKEVKWKQERYPRDYLAMYRRSDILEHDLSFQCIDGRGGGYSIAKQLWDRGYSMGMVPVPEMAANVYHVAHGTAAVRSEKPLNHKRSQKKVEQTVKNLFDEPWIKQLLSDTSLDEPLKSAA